MDTRIIQNWNERVKPGDTVFHIGDFCFKNSPNAVHRGEGGYQSANYYESKLKGKIIFINGSHDGNNTCKTPIERIWLHYGGKSILLLHNPVHFLEDELPLPNLILCGHVHEKWKTEKTKIYGIPLINVGQDVWDYRPVPIGEILKVIEKKAMTPGDLLKSGIIGLLEHRKDIDAVEYAKKLADETFG